MNVETISVNGKRFYLLNGRKYPSVTTILSTIHHKELEEWRRRLGKRAEELMRERAAIGSAIHYRILSKYSIRALEPPKVYTNKDLKEWLQEVEYRCELAEIMWDELNLSIDDIPYIEHTMYSKHGFAGTADLIGKINGIDTLADIKTGFFFSTAKLQLAAYYIMCKESDIKVDRGLIINIHPFDDRNNSLKPKLMEIPVDELISAGKEFLNLVTKFHRGER